jgi:hypothetical protein
MKIRIDKIGTTEHNMEEQWAVQFHPGFDPEFMQLPVTVQQMILARAELLRSFGPQLGRPQVDTLKGSKHPNMKELRFDADDGCWRVAFAFDVKRRAVLWLAETSPVFRRTSSIEI